MNNTEYEYSFKVTDLTPFLKYCEDNNYEKIEESKQIKSLYKKEDKTMARITVKENNGIIEKFFDFKDDNMSDKVLIERRETKAICFEDDEAIFSIIDFLGYKPDKTLDRKRYVYSKENVKFELDSYNSPEIMLVVAIEGDKEQTDLVYNELIQECSEYIK